jgi:uncharacterized repeat protein (TIGR02543 family)
VTVGQVYGTLPTPALAGYTFEGWYTAAIGGANVTSGTVATGNATIFAHWTANDVKESYTVTFDATGGSVSPNTKAINAGAAVGELPMPTRSGYTFKGWFTSPSGGEQVSVSTLATESITYYALWEAIVPSTGTETPPVTGTPPSTTGTPPPTTGTPPSATGTETSQANHFNVAFNANGGSVSQKSKTVADGAPVGSLPAPKRTGYDFKGWYTAKFCGTKISANTVIGSDTTYYAQWKVKNYKATFNANKGKVSGKAKLVKSVKYNSKLGKLATPKRTGYKFKGWYTKKSGGKKVKASTKMSAKNVVYYAQWKK